VRKHVREAGVPAGATADSWNDEQWLDYLMHEAADERPLGPTMPSSVLDRGHAGMRLNDFVEHAVAKRAGLTKPHVLAVRLYSCTVYKQINNPLRDGCSPERPHPYPATITFLTDAVKKLRNDVVSATNHPAELYRGVRDMDVDDEFRERGGTELAFMSTTSDRAVAERYATAGDGVRFSLLFVLAVPNALQCGADISFASCFPVECEYLYPCGTLLQPRRIKAMLGLSRGSSRGEGMGAAAASAVTFREVKVEPVIP